MMCISVYPNVKYRVHLKSGSTRINKRGSKNRSPEISEVPSYSVRLPRVSQNEGPKIPKRFPTTK